MDYNLVSTVLLKLIFNCISIRAFVALLFGILGVLTIGVYEPSAEDIQDSIQLLVVGFFEGIISIMLYRFFYMIQ